MTSRDVAIKRCIAEFGPVTVEHLVFLDEPSLGCHDTLWRRLTDHKPLITGKHIFVRKRARGERYVYASWDIGKRKDCDHDLLISWTHLALYKAFEILDWHRPKEKRKGQLNEDASFVLKHPAGEVHYYLEADTGTEAYSQVQEKLERYGQHFDRVKAPFLVLFITAEAQRAKGLARKAARVVSKARRKIYLFADIESLKSYPGEAICHIPHEDTLYSVLPKV
jgi:hypothetical protein